MRALRAVNTRGELGSSVDGPGRRCISDRDGGGRCASIRGTRCAPSWRSTSGPSNTPVPAGRPGRDRRRAVGDRLRLRIRQGARRRARGGGSRRLQGRRRRGRAPARRRRHRRPRRSHRPPLDVRPPRLPCGAGPPRRRRVHPERCRGCPVCSATRSACRRAPRTTAPLRRAGARPRAGRARRRPHRGLTVGPAVTSGPGLRSGRPRFLSPSAAVRCCRRTARRAHPAPARRRATRRRARRRSGRR